jgi:isoquinoline 1-oxidoreductase
MSPRPVDPPVEAERYELVEGPSHLFEVERRTFMKIFGGGVLVLSVAGGALAQESGRRGFRRDAMPDAIDAWLHIADDGAVTVYTGKVEVGQNIRTSLAQAVAEELKVAVGDIRLVMGDTRLTPYDMGTFGSRTTPTMAPELRRAAAAAREVLVGLAAERWKRDRAGLEVRTGRVVDPLNGHGLTYGELTRGQKLMRAIPAGTTLEPASAWTVGGTPIRKVNGREIVTGRHQYPSDITRPGMLTGRIVRPSAFHATLASLDAAAAAALAGVTVVHDGDFVGVAAPDERTAVRAAGLVKATWTAPPQVSSAGLFEHLRETAEPGRGRGDYEAGSVEDALKTADHALSRTYTVEYIAHVPLEPRAAVAEWRDGGLTVWTGTQRPFGVQQELADAFHLPLDKVHVLMPDCGSGYGGKHTGECAIEAARLAKAAGKPVKVVWTREEELTWAYFRPAGVIDVRSGTRGDGTLVAWAFDNYNSGPSAIRTMYEVPNQRIRFIPADSPLRQGSYRGLAATANHFARESHMDEIAHAVGMDPLAFRLKNLKDDRLRAAFQAAADKFGWAKARAATAAPGRGVGIAGGFEKGGNVATCAEVEVDRDSGAVRIARLVTAFECGAIVNPDGLRNQVMGAAIMGIGGALFEAIRFDNGRIVNDRLSEYRVPRQSDVPAIDVVLIDRKDLPSAGAGETPIVGVAPAVGNAIFEATGVRLRAMPLAPRGVPLAAPASGKGGGTGL